MPRTNPVEIVEVGPRDGLQNEKVPFTTAMKVEYVNRAVAAGLRRIEVTSFVNQKLIPQMADAEAVMAALPKRDDVTYIALILSPRGVQRAAAAGVKEVNFGLPVTTTFCQRNQRATTAEAIAHFAEVAKVARGEGIRPTVVFGVSFGCPFEGEVPLARVMDVAKQVLEHGPDEIGIADTIGVGVPTQVTERVEAIRELAGDIPIRCHFHNTRNTGLANAVAAVRAGADYLDASIGGIGGCNFAPRATGNIPTEDLFYLLDRMGEAPDLELPLLLDTVSWLESQLGRDAPGLVSKAGSFPGGRLLPIDERQTSEAAAR